MRAQPSLIGYIWLVWNEIIVDALSVTIDTLRGSLSCAAKTRKLNPRTRSSSRAIGIVRPEPEAGLGSIN